MFSLIVARDICGGIAKNGKIPWRYSQDMKWFKYATSGMDGLYKKNAVVMGHNTWKTLGKPLPGRLNIVIGNYGDNAPINNHVQFYKSPQEFLRNSETDFHYWICGGKQIYDWFMNQNLVYKLYITEIKKDYKCNLHFQFEMDNWCPSAMFDTHILKFNDVNDDIAINVFSKINWEEQEILDTIGRILENGHERNERTSVGTKAIFGGALRFDLKYFPLMTSRPHSLRIIFEELMWILRGQRNVGILEEKKINIWSPNSTQEFIDKQNLEIPLMAGDIGESYGHNMRHFTGADNREFDQLANVLYLLQNNPTSRRIIICLWNSAGVKRAALPPCLCWYQFFVRKVGDTTWLDCQAMNRSSDILVAGNWNVSTAALLTYILAAATGMKPGILSWVFGDAHIYMNNLDAARQLIQRSPKSYPSLIITKPLATLADIENLQYSDLKLFNYDPIKPQIKMAMNA